MDVLPGEVHGILGPNGAGKSTTVRVIRELITADAGTIRLFDGDPWTDAARLDRRLAYVPGDVNLWPGLTGGQTIDLLGGGIFAGFMCIYLVTRNVKGPEDNGHVELLASAPVGRFSRLSAGVWILTLLTAVVVVLGFFGVRRRSLR
ncbi:energy-coupling factor transporter ATP-binding protein EcfA2 [Neomicrococcus lactis]|uniref:Energy-coupling factor transporter ATP-binding protein EcfA2 n=1 Tax=Neomicrococcus lactis TaxID=732241 RepID=A0A7W9DBM8_9MICC|nr:energy-coupling factor transporter ATP-binding protein EcfA2 [Neomicrococcus lactis]